MNVVIALEDAVSGKRILQFIQSHDWPDTAEFTVLHCIEPVLQMPAPNEKKDTETPWTDAEQARLKEGQPLASHAAVIPVLTPEIIEADAEKLVADFVTELTEAAPFASVKHTVVRTMKTNAAEAILSFATSVNAEMIVIGRHGRNANSRFVLGSVASTILYQSSCSIAIVNTNGDTNTSASNVYRILIPVFDMAHGRASIDFILKHRWPVQVECRLLHAIHPLLVASELGLRNSGYLNELRERLYSSADQILTLLQGHLKDNWADCKVDIRIVDGFPKEEILREAQEWSSQLVVLGSDSRKTIAHLLSGSVADSVAAHLPCSAVVIRVAGQDVSKESNEKPAVSFAKLRSRM